MDIIKIDGTTKSDLDWSLAREAAKKTKRTILWDLDLGLFDRLPSTIIDEVQCKNLCLAVEYFCSTLWEEFYEQTAGLCLYNGPLDYSLKFPWDETQREEFSDWVQKLPGKQNEILSYTLHEAHLKKLYCRDVCTQYFDVLTSFTPASLQIYVVLDAEGITSPLHCAQMLSGDRYAHIEYDVNHLPYRVFPQANLAICLPESSFCLPACFDRLEEAFSFLQQNNLHFRVVSEANLTMEWDGIDDLFVAPSGLGPQGIRKLQGFSAAGGRVVNTGDLPLGLSQEITLQQWLDGGMMRENKEVYS